MNLQKSHLVAVGSTVIGFALMIGGLHEWKEALTPSFVSGALLSIGGLLTALGGEAIQGRRVLSEAERAQLRQDQSSKSGIFKFW